MRVRPTARTWLLIALAAVVAAFLALMSARERPRPAPPAPDVVEVELAP